MSEKIWNIRKTMSVLFLLLLLVVGFLFVYAVGHFDGYNDGYKRGSQENPETEPSLVSYSWSWNSGFDNYRVERPRQILSSSEISVGDELIIHYEAVNSSEKVIIIGDPYLFDDSNVIDLIKESDMGWYLDLFYLSDMSLEKYGGGNWNNIIWVEKTEKSFSAEELSTLIKDAKFDGRKTNSFIRKEQIASPDQLVPGKVVWIHNEKENTVETVVIVSYPYQANGSVVVNCLSIIDYLSGSGKSPSQIELALYAVIPLKNGVTRNFNHWMQDSGISFKVNVFNDENKLPV